MLILDTDALSARERADAFQAVISGNASTSTASFEQRLPVQAKAHLYELGPGRVFNVEASGNTLRRTPTMARRDEQTAIALALPLAGRNVFRTGRHEAVVGQHDLLLVDLDRPYEYGWSGIGTSYAFQVDREDLGLSMDTVTFAVPRLAMSPLYDFVRDHVREVTLAAADPTDPEEATRVGEVTLTLMRALVASAGKDRAAVETTRAAVLMLRVKSYVRRHLRDPGLDAQQIADAHHLSLRSLYALCEQSHLRLEGWILDQRLAAAKADLADSTSHALTIRVIAMSWGFGNASFFAARFRATYGITPSDWRLTNYTQT